MKILWLSNKLLSNEDNGTGTWLNAMSSALVESGKLELGNIALGKVQKPTRSDNGAIKQWVIPFCKPKYNGLPSKNDIYAIVDTTRDFSPDLIHIWGVEGFWGLLTSRKLLDQPALLEMQGLKGSIVPVYHGGLSFREQLACLGIKEILLRSSIFDIKNQYQRWNIFEKETISGHHNISVHSEWTLAQVKAINSNANIYHNDPMLRNAFYNRSKWAYTGAPVIYCSASYPAPFKGVHIAIRSLAILKKSIPNIQMRIAGPHQRLGFRREGYINWVNKEIERLDLTSNVTWLGFISADQTVNELLNCSIFLLPSFLESYSVSLAEALMLGVPSVTSYTGGTSFLAKNEESALFFPPGDTAMCAYQLERLLSDRLLANRLSYQAREKAIEHNNYENLVQKQIEIYRQVLM